MYGIQHNPQSSNNWSDWSLLSFIALSTSNTRGFRRKNLKNGAHILNVKPNSFDGCSHSGDADFVHSFGKE